MYINENVTSNPGVVGDTDAAFLVVGHHRHLSRAACAVPSANDVRMTSMLNACSSHTCTCEYIIITYTCEGAVTVCCV